MSQTPNHRPIAVIAAEICDAIKKIAVLNDEMTQSMTHEQREKERREKRNWRYKRYRQRLKKKRGTPSREVSMAIENRSVPWRGITYLDMTGKNPTEKKLNLSLLKRRDLPQFASCYDLHGAELKAELSRITQINRDKSLKAAAEQRAKNQPPA